ncbi:MarR family winged helix-turn-helix transcriptional regulator [Clavibacter michiganensis]|uniref:MarR family transcriptional regulator n=2 Tax=Clavibacter michiganensis subsp. insidiosus TaxID=33014 RepID=A0A0D5CG90_9MICO|nr:MarR family transcriptional regulator [Clavibacter michiganensis]AJW78315.1 MarR family transcriptional regulator [Clavibacter michiganensis subsp. insidiosus]AWF99267.1 MarR family transcriptional regulator [Clavibacter michiganensis subsp. insidiosus]AWG00619.1 MarR family transcriptional regulator [Clavibacter michiganensis subsp. insidiosus]OQJ60772.1 MarR family transcriptional regulator [Clavibacter michiganensis subsp. insidiosus]RII85070.1 MarR family transcriptional regulator [Clav
MSHTIAVPGDRSEVLEQLRDYTTAFDDSVRQLAAAVGLPTTDTTALAEIIWAETADRALSPARLSERLHLTSGATTALINRLEGGGHIGRSREVADRRVVTLRPTAASRARVMAVLQGAQVEVDRALDGFTAEQLRTAAAVIRAITDGTAAGTRGMAGGGATGS